MPSRKETAAVNKSAGTRESLPYDPVEWEKRLAMARQRRAEVLKRKQLLRDAAPVAPQPNAQQALDAARFRAVPFAAVSDLAPSERREDNDAPQSFETSQPDARLSTALSGSPGYSTEAGAERYSENRRSRTGRWLLAGGCFAAGIVAVLSFDLFFTRSTSLFTPQTEAAATLPAQVRSDSTVVQDPTAETVSDGGSSVVSAESVATEETAAPIQPQEALDASDGPAIAARVLDSETADVAPEAPALGVTTASLGLVEPEEIAPPEMGSEPPAPSVSTSPDSITSEVAALGPEAAASPEPTSPIDETPALAAQEPENTAIAAAPSEEDTAALAALSAESLATSVTPDSTEDVGPPPQPLPRETTQVASEIDVANVAGDTNTALGGIRAIIHVPQQAPNETVASAEAAIADLGIPAVPPRATGFNISQTHLRYYHPEDAQAAELLGESIGAPVRDFTAHRPLPNSGLVEVWVAGTSAAPVQPAPQQPQQPSEPPAPTVAAAPPEPVVPRQPKTISLSDLENVQRQVRDLMGQLLPSAGN